MHETVLLTGYTDFVNAAFLAAAFPDCRIVISGNADLKTSLKGHITVYKEPLDEGLCREIFRTYDVDRIVCFSHSAAPFSGFPGEELQMLTTLFSYCTQDMKILYVMGPKHPDSELVSQLEKTARTICAQFGNVNVLISPWLYTVQAYQPALTRFFEKGVHELPYHEEQPLTFLASEDFAVLLFRMFDAWEVSPEPFVIPNAFVCTAKAFSSAVPAASDSGDIRFTFSDREPCPLVTEPDARLRSRFKWSPVYSFLDDLPELVSLYRKRSGKRTSVFGQFFHRKNILLPLSELVSGLFVTELILRLTGSAAQFRTMDFRLLYVVIFGTVYNMRMGLAAAALAGLSMVYSYSQEGVGWITLFYEPANWLPFIAYFTVGALCGYIRSRDREQIQAVREESASVSERYQHLAAVNREILEEKRKYKDQIIGSRGSFGKLFEITRQLNTDHPMNLMAVSVGILERIMGSRSAAIYRCPDGSPHGRLMVSSRDAELPGSLKMQPYYEKLRSVGKGEVWVNRELDEAFPRYLYAVWKEDTVEAVILLGQAEFSRMTLYYENLFKVVCGLIASSLLRADAYQNAVRTARCVPGTSNLLQEAGFTEELRYAVRMLEQHLAQHLLLRIAPDGGLLSENAARAAGCIRRTDVMGWYRGALYVLLHQAAEKDMPVIGRRFEKGNIAYTMVSSKEQQEMLLTEDGAV